LAEFRKSREIISSR